MKKLLLPLVALLALALTACDDNDKNPFQDTTWTSTTYVEGFTATLDFSDLTCSLSFTSDSSTGFQPGANYVYSHSGNTASLIPIGEICCINIDFVYLQ